MCNPSGMHVLIISNPLRKLVNRRRGAEPSLLSLEVTRVVIAHRWANYPEIFITEAHISFKRWAEDCAGKRHRS